MKVRASLTAVVTAAGIGAMALTAAPAGAASGPVFTVMNTSEQPPDGVWFRNSPQQNDTNRETGFGVYMNEQVQASCFSWGDAVGPWGNEVWYYATDISRPTVNGHPNTGYMNTHYVNDGMSANQVYPGIPECGTTTSPPPVVPAPAAIYYSPYNSDSAAFKLADTSVGTVYKSDWASGTCGNSAPAYSQALSHLQSGQSVGTLSGWSLGRTGPLYFLQRATPSQVSQVSYIILIDPGVYSELSCDRQINAGGILANWLLANPGAHLVVISSNQVSQQQNSKGIQESYFNAIRNMSNQTGINLRPRVLTCNYTFSHQHAFFSAQYWIAHQIGTTSCPTLRDSGGTYQPTAAWHP